MGLFDKQENGIWKKIRRTLILAAIKFVLPPVIIIVLLASFWYIIGKNTVKTVSNVIRTNGTNINVTKEGRKYIIDGAISKNVNKELKEQAISTSNIGLSDELINKFYKAEIITSFPDLREKSKIGTPVEEGEIQGCIQFKRDGQIIEYMPFEDFQKVLAKFGYSLEDSNGNAYAINNSEVYKSKGQVESKYEEELKGYFTLDDENNLIIAKMSSQEVKTNYNAYAQEELQRNEEDEDSSQILDDYQYIYNVDIKRINYQTELQKYSMPIEFLTSLLMVSQNSGFCEAVADLAKDSKIVVEIQDNISTTETEEKYDYISHFYVRKQYEYQYEEVVGNQASNQDRRTQVATSRRLIVRDDEPNYTPEMDLIPNPSNGEQNDENEGEQEQQEQNQNPSENENTPTTEPEREIKTIIKNATGVYIKGRDMENPYRTVVTTIKSNTVNLCVVEAKTWLIEAKAEYNVTQEETTTNNIIGLEYQEKDENEWTIPAPEDINLEGYSDVEDNHKLLEELSHENLPNGATKVEDSTNNIEQVKEKKDESEETTIINSKTQNIKYTKVSSEVINKEENFLSLLRVDPTTNMFNKQDSSKNTKLIKYKNQDGKTFSPEDNILSATQVLFDYIASSEHSQSYEETMRYLFYLYTGKSYGVTSFDFSEYEAGEFTRIINEAFYGNSIEEKVWFALKELGFNDIVIAGAMGNISYESGGFNPSAVEAGGTGEGIGLIQWSFGRRKALEEYAKNRTLQIYGEAKEDAWKDVDIQIEFLIAEISGEGSAQCCATRRTSGYIKEEGKEYTATFADWANATTIEDSTLAFMRFFESPTSKYSYDHDYTKDGIYVGSRLTRAKQYYNEFEGREGLSYSSTYYTSKQAKAMVDWAESYVGKSVFYRPTDNWRFNSYKYCAAFAESAHCAAGFSYLAKNAIDIPHPNAITYYANGKVDYSSIPIGAYIVSRGTNIQYGHVALYVGNGYVIEAGGTTIVKQKIDESYGRGKFLGWGT